MCYIYIKTKTFRSTGKTLQYTETSYNSEIILSYLDWLRSCKLLHLNLRIHVSVAHKVVIKIGVYHSRDIQNVTFDDITGCDCNYWYERSWRVLNIKSINDEKIWYRVVRNLKAMYVDYPTNNDIILFIKGL